MFLTNSLDMLYCSLMHGLICPRGLGRQNKSDIIIIMIHVGLATKIILLKLIAFLHSCSTMHIHSFRSTLIASCRRPSSIYRH